ncbi:kinetochore-associated Ndc80 complex subunit ndc80 [Tulasnella sp. 419]|nr:kinetochore-associated Ndc80 complex subunit ndc80 [Tulasnella sp. 418]KAG8952837.1 kinetochore-associated Ndc80 complex subunit ndc80 [Tulasnella sp. 419]
MASRPPLAPTNMNNVFAHPSSSIPLPASAVKRRADMPPPMAPPPQSRMRMSIAGGPGPSRPPALPAASQSSQPGTSYAPRASLFGGGASQGFNPLLQSTRRPDTSQYGKTPSKSALQGSVRRPAQSTGRPTFASANWTVPKEVRPIRDRTYQAMMQREILDYLTQQRCAIPNLSMKTLQTPTNREFHLIFQFLITDMDDKYVFGREKKPEDEVILLLRDMRYPLVDTISKTSLAAPGSSSAWPTLLAMLHWIVTLSHTLKKWGDPEVCPDYNLMPVQDIPLEEEVPNYFDLVICDYTFAAYMQYMYGADDFKEQDEELEAIIDRKNEAVIQRCDEKEIRIARLKADIEKLKANPSELVALDREYEKFEVDMQKLRLVIEERESKVQRHVEMTTKLNEYIAQAEGEIRELNLEHERLLQRVEAQGLTPEEIQQMNTERDTLKRTLEDLGPKVSEAVRTTGDLEVAVAKRADSVEQVVTRYTTLVYNTGMHPHPPPPFENVNFKLELNTAVTNPMDMLKADMRKVIHPALMQVAEAKRKERAAIDYERIKAEDELDQLTQQCETMMEEAEPKENQLKVLLNKTEELRETVAAETAASSAESNKLERDLGQMEASVQQSEVALRSRKQRLQVEFADIVHKTEHLKEQTKKKITSECNQMLKFKQDIAKELEGLVLFARDN